MSDPANSSGIPPESKAETPQKEMIHLDANPKSLDISKLPKDQQDQLRAKQADLAIDLQKKAAELQLDNMALSGRLDDITGQVAEADRDEISATVTGSYKDGMGTTEVIMGNTEGAAKGKLNRAQRGLPDQTMTFVIIGVIAVLILAAILAG
jgi:hypothetical protein